jgi:hypothetical protein
LKSSMFHDLSFSLSYRIIFTAPYSGRLNREGTRLTGSYSVILWNLWLNHQYNLLEIGGVNSCSYVLLAVSSKEELTLFRHW